MEKVVRNVAKTVEELRPFDDTFMQVLAEDRGFRDLPDVYMIYITEKDFLKGEKSFTCRPSIIRNR